MEINHKAPAKATQETQINAPIEVVWKLVSDINDWTRWRSAVKSAKLNGPLAAETTFVWNSGVTITSTIKEVLPESKIAWTGRTMGIHAIHTWTFTKTESGTKVVTSESFEGFLCKCFPKLMTRMLVDTLTKDLAELKAEAEKQAK